MHNFHSKKHSKENSAWKIVKQGSNNDAFIGGAGSSSAFSMTITGMRVYNVGS